MKKAKWAIGVFIFLLCMILTGELYQNYLTLFQDQFYFFRIGIGDDRSKLYDRLSEAVDRRDMAVFAVELHTRDAFTSSLDVYANDKARKMLEEDYGISAGRKESLFSGSTEVAFHDLFGAIDEDIERPFYFGGQKDDVDSLRDEINQTYACGYYHKEGAGVNTWLIYAVWGVSFLFLLVLTWLDIQFQKKENFVRISLGCSPIRIALKNMALDIAVFLAAFLMVRFLLGRYVSLDYGWKGAVVCLGVFLLANSLLYLTLLRYDYKEILYGANLSENTLSTSYVLKAVIMIVTVASLSTNVALIARNARYLGYYEDIRLFQDYGSLNVDQGLAISDEDSIRHGKLWTELFLRGYKDGKVAFSVDPGMLPDGSPLIVLSERMEAAVSNGSLFSGLGDVDFHVFAPTQLAEDEETMEFALRVGMGQFGFEEDEVTSEVIPYSDDTEVLYFDVRKSTSRLSYGFEEAKNPVFVYCTVPMEKIEMLLQDPPLLEDTNRMPNYLFKLSNEEIDSLRSAEGVEDVSYVPITEVCEQHRAQLMRIAALNTMISIFLLALELVVIVTCIKYEYTVNAKLLALKKIFGYSVISKNRDLFLLNLASAGIAIVTMVIFSLMFGLVEVPAVLGVGIALAAAEAVFITYHVMKLERTSIPKILKGGSL